MNGWDDLVTTALLGTERRSVDAARLPEPVAAGLRAESDPATGVLAAAALATSYRRAGARPARIPHLPAAAPTDDLPPVGTAAASRLAGLLAGGDTELIIEWLRSVAAAGRRAPAESMPALLDLAGASTADSELAAAIVAATGRRGAWLAGLQPRWSKALAAHLPPAPPAGSTSGQADHAGQAEQAVETLWTHGEPSERRRYFTELRRRAPAAAAALLLESWKQETGPDRHAFVGMLAEGLCGSDEVLLEVALDDRRRDVREAAALLLSQLPHSAFAGRMSARIAECVRIDRRLTGRRITVTPPEACDKAMERDGIRAKRETKQLGDRAWWLGQLVLSTPLPVWRELFDIEPPALLSLSVEDGWGRVLRDGWTAAAVRQNNAQWALALLPKVSENYHCDLVRTIPEGQRADAVTSLLRRSDLFGLTPRTVMQTRALLSECPAPWPQSLTDAVLAQLKDPKGDPTSYGVRDYLRLAGRRLPPDLHPEFARLAARHRDNSPWNTALHALADTLNLRHDMLEEIR